MIIGLTGKAGSGKDTAADAICEEIPELERYALAGPIKELAEAWLGLTPGYLSRDVKESYVAFNIAHEMFECLDIIIYNMFKDKHGLISMPKAKETAKAIYDALMYENMYCNVEEEFVNPQFLITTPRRILQVIGTEGFRDCVDQQFWLKIAPYKNAVITDIRFDNEAEWFRECEDSIIIKILRPDHDSIAESNHSSELGIRESLVEMSISNNGTIKNLQQTVIRTVAEHMRDSEVPF